MNIEEQKKEIIKMLGELDEEITTLRKRVQEARDDLVLVNTMDEALAFDKKYQNMDEGFAYIRLG